MMLKILTVFLKTSDIIVNPLCDISPSLMLQNTSQLQITIALRIAHHASSMQKRQDAYCIMFLLTFTSGTMYDSFVIVRVLCL
jgi:hypothetical protein